MRSSTQSLARVSSCTITVLSLRSISALTLRPFLLTSAVLSRRYSTNSTCLRREFVTVIVDMTTSNSWAFNLPTMGSHFHLTGTNTAFTPRRRASSLAKSTSKPTSWPSLRYDIGGYLSSVAMRNSPLRLIRSSEPSRVTAARGDSGGAKSLGPTLSGEPSRERLSRSTTTEANRATMSVDSNVNPRFLWHASQAPRSRSIGPARLDGRPGRRDCASPFGVVDRSVLTHDSKASANSAIVWYRRPGSRSRAFNSTLSSRPETDVFERLGGSTGNSSRSPFLLGALLVSKKYKVAANVNTSDRSSALLAFSGGQYPGLPARVPTSVKPRVPAALIGRARPKSIKYTRCFP